ncbi:MAG: hypothetical protein GON13_03810 [Nanoarchaeota archaeon]|nr:hypothetical protein [Nanoarchaeota archaeon]
MKSPIGRGLGKVLTVVLLLVVIAYSASNIFSLDDNDFLSPFASITGLVTFAESSVVFLNESVIEFEDNSTNFTVSVYDSESNAFNVQFWVEDDGSWILKDEFFVSSGTSSVNPAEIVFNTNQSYDVFVINATEIFGDFCENITKDECYSFNNTVCENLTVLNENCSVFELCNFNETLNEIFCSSETFCSPFNSTYENCTVVLVENCTQINEIVCLTSKIIVELLIPKKIVRGELIEFSGIIRNNGGIAKNVVVEWFLPDFFEVFEGGLKQEIGVLEKESSFTINITVRSSLELNLGLDEVQVGVGYE